jgi:hypothetical protein
MSTNRAIKRARRHLRDSAREAERLARARRRAPLWRRVLALVYPPIMAQWVANWERRERTEMKRIVKAMSHARAGL